MVGLLGKDLITGVLRSLWVVAVALIALERGDVARRAGRHARTAASATSPCATPSSIGLAQCVALIPGVSRSGATISAGLFRGLDRVTATRLSFFLSIPALIAAGLFELKDAARRRHRRRRDGRRRRWSAFVVAYAAIAWLLRFVATTRSPGSCPTGSALGVLAAGAAGAGVLSRDLTAGADRPTASRTS